LKIWQYRIRIYGFFDPIIVAIARRLGLEKLRRQAQNRINLKIIDNLK